MKQRLVRLSSIALACCALAAFADDWPQFRGPRRDGVWRETGIIDKFDRPTIAARWRAPVSNGYSSPTVAGGRVYLMDRLVEPTEQERVLCFDEQTGKQLWTYTYPCVYKDVGYPDGPRAAVNVFDGRAYSVGTTGHVHCLDATTGKVLWQHDGRLEYKVRVPDWGVAADPFIEGDSVMIHFGGVGACVVAFDRKTGKERWRALNDLAGYAAPTIVQQAGQRVILVWTGERIVGLDPATGKLHWEYPYAALVRIGATCTPAVFGEYIFVSSWHEGALLLRMKADKLGVEKVWKHRGQNERETQAFHQLMTNPILERDHIYGIDTFGELRCLDFKTGARIWESQAVVPRARNVGVHFVRNGDRYFAFNERGELIICKLSARGYEEISRALLIKPTRGQFNQRNGVVWSHPAYANKCVFIRNDEELICASLAK